MDWKDADTQPWPLRAWALALLGAVAGLGVYLLVDDVPGRASGSDDSRLRYAVATLLGVGSLAFAHGWTRGQSWRGFVSGGAGGLIVALVFLWNGTPEHDWSGGESWRIVAAMLCVFILVPLVQAFEENGVITPSH
ncbi:MAG: hypothetical protein ABW184_16825, partial [Sphingobium sp.]